MSKWEHVGTNALETWNPVTDKWKAINKSVRLQLKLDSMKPEKPKKEYEKPSEE